MNENKQANKNRIKIILLILLMMLVLVLGTYAWFTLSQYTSTSVVTSKTGEDGINLYISATGGDDFKKETEVKLPEIGENKLMPVSTADLATFLYSPSSRTSSVSTFAEDTDSEYYYKATVYILAESTESRTGNKLDLYLDDDWYKENSTDLVTAVGGTKILDAARFGLSFDDANPTIMCIGNVPESSDMGNTHTVIDGNVIPYGNVITKQSGKLIAVADPCANYDSFKPGTSQKQKVIFSMEFNKIYKMNIYFYIEGTDADCEEEIQDQQIDLQLALYGVLNSEGD